MKLHVIHRTRYEYPAAVIESFNETRLQPTSADGQICHGFLLKVLPSTRLSHYLDFYLNCVHFFEIPEPHTSLGIESSATVTTVSHVLPPDQATVPMSRLRECLAMEQCYDFLQSSKYVDIEPAVWRLAVDATMGEQDAWQAAVKVMQLHPFRVRVRARGDDGPHPIAEAIEKRKGVCQDFTHVMLGDVPQPENPGPLRERLPLQRPAGRTGGSAGEPRLVRGVHPGFRLARARPHQ